jgi:hypothetical protein
VRAFELGIEDVATSTVGPAVQIHLPASPTYPSLRRSLAPIRRPAPSKIWKHHRLRHLDLPTPNYRPPRVVASTPSGC